MVPVMGQRSFFPLQKKSQGSFKQNSLLLQNNWRGLKIHLTLQDWKYVPYYFTLAQFDVKKSKVCIKICDKTFIKTKQRKLHMVLFAFDMEKLPSAENIYTGASSEFYKVW